MSPSLAFLPSVGLPELLILLAIAVLILGPKQIPKAGRALGRGLRNFRSSVSGKGGEEDDPQLNDSSEEEPSETAAERESGTVADEGKAGP